jgi:hypothetical protein
MLQCVSKDDSASVIYNNKKRRKGSEAIRTAEDQKNGGYQAWLMRWAVQERGSLLVAAATSGLAKSERFLNLQDTERQATRHELLQTVSDVLIPSLIRGRAWLECRGAMIYVQ